MEVTKLPGVLVRFFRKYPPEFYSAKFTGASYPLVKNRNVESESRVSSEDLANEPSPVAPVTESKDPSATQTETTAPVPLPMRSTREIYNPFLPYKNPATGRWHVRIGLRRQADLVKLAKKFGVEPLLPPGRKSTEFKHQKALEKGLRVRGTGEGQTVKGHVWERTMSATLDKRRKAMEEMPEMIRLWKQRGHGRGWKKYPR